MMDGSVPYPPPPPLSDHPSKIAWSLRSCCERSGGSGGFPSPHPPSASMPPTLGPPASRPSLPGRPPPMSTTMDAVVMTAGPVRNLTAMAKPATELPHAMIFGYSAMNKHVQIQTPCGIITSNLECPINSMALGKHSKEEVTSSLLSGRLEQVTVGHSSLSLEQDAAILSMSHACNVQSSANLGCDAPTVHNKDITKPCFSVTPNKENANTVDVSSTVEYNPFYPYKKLGQVKHADASECGSTTGPLEESEPLRLWKKMKQNGFLSLSHGGIPLPKQQAREPRKRKKEESKKKTEMPKREQVNRFTKFAAPSGLLSGLDPGIIKHVRNSKQVHSIIEAMVRLENCDQQIHNKLTGHSVSEGTTETNDKRKDQNYTLVSDANQYAQSQERPYVPLISGRGKINEQDTTERRFPREMCTSQFATEYDNNTLALKLSSVVTKGNSASSASHDDLSSNQENITTLSIKAASVSSQWLELLQMDIRGRLAALRLSKKRVRNVVQTELPYLLSTELSSNLESGPSPEHSSGIGCSTSDVHVAQWRSLFGQMDKTLYEEAKHLESWLRQVQELQLHCDRGLRDVGADALSQIGSSENSRRSKEPDEKERAVMAAAASIYSTCNFVTKENVPCF